MAADAFIGYDELDGAVTRLKLGIAPAELHGSLCGFLAGGGQVGQQPLVEALHMDAEISPSAPDDALLRDLVKQSEAELADPELGFEPLLPADDRSLPERAESITTGTCARSGSPRSAASRPKPSSCGIITSVSTRSGGSARARSSATAPSGAVTTR